MKSTNWIAAFPGLQKLSPELLKSLADTGEVVDLPAGTQIFGPGRVPEAYLLLLDGVVRVQQISDSGREIRAGHSTT
jgi:CRP/FNR family transcriptional regulator, anaerobic regulatory protein